MNGSTRLGHCQIIMVYTMQRFLIVWKAMMTIRTILSWIYDNIARAINDH